MSKQASLTHVYNVSAETLWQDLLDPNALAESMQGAITYVGLPREPVQQGDEFTVQLKRWGWFPIGRWTMKVVERDDQNFVLRSEEHGGLVKLYKHRLSILPTGPQSCEYTDHLDVDAGWLTSLVFPTFENMYQRRHEMRKARLEST